MPYCTANDVQGRWGAELINQWAEVARDDASTVADRIDNAINSATADIDSILTGSRYAFPLAVAAPKLIVDICAALAGVWLYDGPRGVPDREAGTDSVAATRQWAYTTLHEIRAGLRALPLAAVAAGYPHVPTITEPPTSDLGTGS
jgi:phage gp36-like protein